MSKIKDLQGKRFGKLEVLEYAGLNKHNGALWKCLCDCGTTKIVGSNDLCTGKITSCTCNRGNPLSPGEASKNEYLYLYQQNAKHRNLEFSLTSSDFEKLTKEKCHYCGIEPSLKFNENKPGRNGFYLCNGIDRIKNEIGYIRSNCVTCCKTCNAAKSSMTYEEFITWVDRLVQFRGE